MEVLFINFNFADMLNQYLTNIFILKTNVTTLYFNIKGEGSYQLIKELYNDISNIENFYLSLGSLIKKIGSNPITNLNDINNISTLKQISSQDYTAKEALNILSKDLSIINKMNNQVGEYSLKNFKFNSINLVLEFNKYLEKRVGELNNIESIHNLN